MIGLIKRNCNYLTVPTFILLYGVILTTVALYGLHTENPDSTQTLDQR